MAIQLPWGDWVKRIDAVTLERKDPVTYWSDRNVWRVCVHCGDVVVRTEWCGKVKASRLRDEAAALMTGTDGPEDGQG